MQDMTRTPINPSTSPMAGRSKLWGNELLRAPLEGESFPCFRLLVTGCGMKSSRLALCVSFASSTLMLPTPTRLWRFLTSISLHLRSSIALKSLPQEIAESLRRQQIGRREDSRAKYSIMLLGLNPHACQMTVQGSGRGNSEFPSAFSGFSRIRFGCFPYVFDYHEVTSAHKVHPSTVPYRTVRYGRKSHLLFRVLCPCEPSTVFSRFRTVFRVSNKKRYSNNIRIIYESCVCLISPSDLACVRACVRPICACNAWLSRSILYFFEPNP